MIDLNIPFYGEEKFLFELLKTTKNQTLIKKVNISCDTSIIKVDELIKYQNVNIEYNFPPLGMVKNWNKCLSTGSEPYVSVFHYDDYILPQYSEMLEPYIRKYPKVGLIVLGFNVNYSNQFLNIKSKIKKTLKELRINGKQEISLIPSGDSSIRFLRSIRIICSGMIINRSIISYIGKFDENLRFSSDEEYWWRIAKSYDILYINAPLVSYRYHRNNHQFTTWENPMFWTNFVQTRQLRFKHLSIPTQIDKDIENSSLQYLARSISNFFMDRNEVDLANKYLGYSQISYFN